MISGGWMSPNLEKKSGYRSYNKKNTILYVKTWKQHICIQMYLFNYTVMQIS